MGDSVVTTQQKRAAATLIKNQWGVHLPTRLLKRLSYDQIRRIMAILNEK